MLPKFDYYLEESDPDIAILRRQDGAFAAAFSARGVRREGILEAAKEDYRRLLEANADFLGPLRKRCLKEERLERLEAKPRRVLESRPSELSKRIKTTERAREHPEG